MDNLHFIINSSTSLIASGGVLLGFGLVFLECFIPALPLSVFITLNVNAFGLFLGVLISWLATTLGSFCCYLLFSFLGTRFCEKFVKGKSSKKIKEAVDSFQKISFSSLVLLITLPFTPGFLINIVGGISNISKEKFLSAILIGKGFSTTFWGYIGKNLLESLTDVYSLLFIGVTLILAYIISKLVNKKLNME